MTTFHSAYRSDKSVSFLSQIKLDIIDGESIEYGGYDQSNALVLPSQKRKTKIKKDKDNVTRILSKKQRKNLEKIVDKKKKKEGVSRIRMN